MSRRAISAQINPKQSIAKPIGVRNGFTSCFWFQATYEYATVTTGFKPRTVYVNLPPAICPDCISRGLGGGFPLGSGVLKKAWTIQRHGPTWSVANVRTDMVRNSEHCVYVPHSLDVLSTQMGDCCIGVSHEDMPEEYILWKFVAVCMRLDVHLKTYSVQESSVLRTLMASEYPTTGNASLARSCSTSHAR